MPRITHMVVVALLTLLVAAIAACSEGTGPTPTPSAMPHHAFVFQLKDTLQGPSQIIVYDADAHRIAGKFAAPKGETLGRGDRIYAGLQSRTLRTVSVDGTLSAPLYATPAGEQINRVAPSPDGKVLALDQLVDTGADEAIVLLDLANGHVVHTFKLADIAPGVTSGLVDGVRWHSDSKGVTIRLSLPGQSNAPYPQPSQAALLGVGGTVQKVGLAALAMLSPDGSMAAEGTPIKAGCVGFDATTTLRIVNLATGTVLSTATSPAAGLRPFAWMPDGSGVIYTSSAETGCAPGGSDSTYWLLPAHGDARQLQGAPSSHMGDTVAARVSWSCGDNAPQHFGDGVMANPGELLGEEATCTRLGGPARLPGTPSPTASSPELVHLFVDGQPAFEAYEATLIGQITLPKA